MSLETIVNDLVAATDALHASVTDKRTVLDAAAQAAAASLTTTKGLQTQAAASAATAAAKETEATNNATQIAAYKTAAAALDTTTTATTAVANLLPDMLAKKDPARHPFRKKMPTLVLDFERQKCHRYSPSTGFGETPLVTFMTFARNSTATYTGPDGLLKTAAANEARYDYDPLTGECKGILIEEQRTNLKTYSTFPLKSFGGVKAVLTKSNIVSPDGTLTNGVFERGSTGNGSYAVLNSPVTIGTQTSFVFSLYVKKRDARYMSLRIQEATVYSSMSNAVFDLDTGTVTLQETNVGEYTEADCGITAAGAGWFRVWIKAKTGALPTAYGLFSCSDIPTAGIDGLATVTNLGVYFYGPQLELGAFPTSCIPTPATFTGRTSTATYLDANGVVQTAASGVARSNAYDYDSDGVLRPIGLLLEASATNQLLYSEQFDNAAWGKSLYGVASAPVVTAKYGIAPDGQTTADRVVFALNGGTTIDDRSVLQQPLTTVAGTTYTQSVWLKTADASTKIVQVSFNGETPKLVTVTGTWQRFSNTGVASDTIRGFRLALRGTFGTDDSADLLVWGAQQGVGNYPTSYIPTTTAQVTRAADTSTSAQATRVADYAKVDGTKFSDFYNQLAGTAVTEFSAGMLGGAGYPGAFSVSDGGVNNRFGGCISDVNGDRVQTILRVNGTYATSVYSAQAVTVGQAAKIGVRISRAGWSGAVSGGSTVGTGAAVIPQTMSILKVGVFDTPLNGPVKRITYYPQPFTNEELQAATSA